MPTLLLLGGGSAIGKACASVFAEHGWDIIFAGRNITKMQGIAHECSQSTGCNSWGIAFDILNESQLPQFWDTLPITPDVVLCAVGLYIGGGDEALMWRTNFEAPKNTLEYIASRLHRGGTIIGISSVAGERIRPANAPYGRAKRQLTAYLQDLRRRYQGHLHVLTVLPGTVRSPMTEGRNIPRIALALPKSDVLDVFNACMNGQDVLYTPWFWKPIMAIAKLLPQSVFERFTN